MDDDDGTNNSTRNHREPLLLTRDLLYALHLIDVWRITGLKSSRADPWQWWRRHRPTMMSYRRWLITTASERATRVSPLLLRLCYSPRSFLMNFYVTSLLVWSGATLQLNSFRVWPGLCDAVLQPNCTAHRWKVGSTVVFWIVWGEVVKWTGRRRRTGTQSRAKNGGKSSYRGAT